MHRLLQKYIKYISETDREKLQGGDVYLMSQISVDILRDETVSDTEKVQAIKELQGITTWYYHDED